MIGRRLVAIGLGLLLAGCVTVQNPLGPDQVAGLQLASVDVRFAPDARIWWGDGERQFAALKGLPSNNAVDAAETDEGRAYLRSTLAGKIKPAFEQKLAGALAGSRPVRAEVTVRDVHISSAIQRITVGGNHSMRADVNLVDPKTNAVLVSFPAQTAQDVAGQGILGTLVDQARAEPIDRVIDGYVDTYTKWLLHR